ncbi:DUF3788 family protein [Microbacter margulisiae]|uniref:YdhG-like domain-containing protein n=1 Tax=Microbacter margulisiae TaxID=1350067 RepID=A0A7W5DPA6_9PORP|nr:DUF3788 family protein [Microbacter margulisiae]MBB3186248.1 hypothetical protein [Microbacter margulisiae]
MPASIYTEKSVKPDDAMLAYDLSGTKPYLDKIAAFIEREYGDCSPEWHFYNKKSGWILKMGAKTRNVLFIVPCPNYFETVFTFGDKAAALIFNSNLPDSIKKDLSEAKKYAEGQTIRIEARTDADLDNILEMIRIKLMN